VVVESFEEVAPHARAGSPCDGMAQDEPFEGVGIVAFTVDHVDDLFVVFFPLTKAGGPVVAGASSVFGDEDVFFVEQRSVVGGTVGRGIGEKLVHDARLEVDEKRSGDVMEVVGLVEENVFAVVDEGMRSIARSRRRALHVVGTSVIGMGGIRGMNGHQPVLVVGIDGKVAKLAVGLDAVLEAQLLPEFAADLIPALAYLEGDDFAGHDEDWSGVSLLLMSRGAGSSKIVELAP